MHAASTMSTVHSTSPRRSPLPREGHTERRGVKNSGHTTATDATQRAGWKDSSRCHRRGAFADQKVSDAWAEPAPSSTPEARNVPTHSTKSVSGERSTEGASAAARERTA
jgi:hypothetical protein